MVIDDSFSYNAICRRRISPARSCYYQPTMTQGTSIMTAKTFFCYCVYPHSCAYTDLRRILEKLQSRTHRPIGVGLVSSGTHSTLLNPRSPSPYGVSGIWPICTCVATGGGSVGSFVAPLCQCQIDRFQESRILVYWPPHPRTRVTVARVKARPPFLRVHDHDRREETNVYSGHGPFPSPSATNLESWHIYSCLRKPATCHLDLGHSSLD
ncbi:hypothetical protein BDR03DRAFT_452939 [Suillus americanus]|nr:hypothetical protein BDR03DRAFT_452939 [Suillus americanus]